MAIGPRDAIELQLTQIWSEVLNISPISVMDNFFDLGGHFLLAVPLMAMVEQQFGKYLSLAAIFQGPRISEFAILLRQETTSCSPLVAIQPEGSQPPFFWMPGSGGNVVYFHSLARHLGGDRPFYALQPPSLDGVSTPFNCVEDIPSYYIQVVAWLTLATTGSTTGADRPCTSTKREFDLRPSTERELANI